MITPYELRYLYRTTKDFAKLSKASRLQVGVVIWDAKHRTIRAMGYNGTPTGDDNVCESNSPGGLITKSNVVHAEVNALNKLHWWERIFGNYILLVTHSPCVSCANAIIKVPTIKKVYYFEPYRNSEGIRLLSKTTPTERLYG